MNHVVIVTDAQDAVLSMLAVDGAYPSIDAYLNALVAGHIAKEGKSQGSKMLEKTLAGTPLTITEKGLMQTAFGLK